MIHQALQHLLDRSALVTPRIKLPIGIGSGTTLPKTIITVGIHHLLTVQNRQISTSFFHRLPPLQNDGFETQFYQLQSTKKTGWTCANDVNGRCFFYRFESISVLRLHQFSRRIYIGCYQEKRGSSAGIQRLFSPYHLARMDVKSRRFCKLRIHPIRLHHVLGEEFELKRYWHGTKIRAQ